MNSRYLSNLLVEARSHWYIRIGYATAAVLAIFAALFYLSDGSISPVRFISRAAWDSMDALPPEAHQRKLDELNNLFERDEKLRYQRKRCAGLINLLDGLESIPTIFCIGVTTSGIAFSLDKLFHKLASKRAKSRSQCRSAAGLLYLGR